MSSGMTARPPESPSHNPDQPERIRPASPRPGTLGLSPSHHRRNNSKSECRKSISDGSPPSDDAYQEQAGLRSEFSSSDRTEQGQNSASSTSPEGADSTGEPDTTFSTNTSNAFSVNSSKENSNLCGGCKNPKDDLIVTAPPPMNGIFMMASDCKLQTLLTTIAAWDTNYSGLEDETLTSPMPHGDDWSSEQGPSSFSPFKDTPTSQLPSLKCGISTPSDVCKDGKTTHETPPKHGGVWTMNLLDGKLFLFKSNLKDAQPGKEGEGGAEVGERVGEGEGGGEEEREIVKGVELSKLLNKKTESPEYYFHLPSTILCCDVDNPRVTPIYTPPQGNKYRICRRHDSQTMTPTEYILHHDTVFLVLEEDSSGRNPPVINAVQEGHLKSALETLAKEGMSFPDASYNPVVNIKYEREHPDQMPNNMAIYFTGKHNKYRYYVHINEDRKLIPSKQKLPVDDDDWRQHMQFTNYYHTADVRSLQSFANKQGMMPSSSGNYCTPGQKLPGFDHERRLPKHGLSGTSPASAINTHSHDTDSTVPNGSDERRNGVMESDGGSPISSSHTVTSNCSTHSNGEIVPATENGAIVIPTGAAKKRVVDENPATIDDAEQET